MGNSAFFKQAKTEFDELATNGVIGDPHGQLAYSYIRVSSEEQADENRSGLARQIKHCHDIALQKGYRIPWELVFADDDSGFEFENRDSLLELRRELKSPGRRANVVVMEILDRLSRNADWHQGFLLDEMKRHGVDPLFWKPFSSRVERAVMGAVAQDAMELSLSRMIEGRRDKAKKGRITARTRCYGYILVDSTGKQSPAARKDTHYSIYKPESHAVLRIYIEVASGKALAQIARELTGVYPTPRSNTIWGKSSIRTIVKRPTYKGEFHAFRWTKDKDGRPVENDDYIIVPVPAIVSKELWEGANQMLEKNKQTAARNSKYPYLLTGLLKCASCGRSYVGHQGRTRLNGKRLPTPQRLYQCTSRNDHKREEIGCPQGQIGCKKVDTAVWKVICHVLLKPHVLTEALDRHFTDDGNAGLLEQIGYLEQQLEAKQHEEEKLYRAYVANAFDEHEYAEQRRVLKETAQTLRAEVERLRSRVLSKEQVEAQKQFILETAQQLKKTGKLQNVPSEVKQQIIKLIVSRIILNMREGWFRLEGAVSGTHSFAHVLSDTKLRKGTTKKNPDDSDDPIVMKNTRTPRPA